MSDAIDIGSLVINAVRIGKFAQCTPSTLNIVDSVGVHTPGTLMVVLTVLAAPDQDVNLDVLYALSSRETSWSYIDISGNRAGIRIEIV